MTARARLLDFARGKQVWTIAKIELRRVFFAKRSLWVYGLALLPSVIFFGHGLEAKFRTERLARRGLITPALMDSVGQGESAEDVKKRIQEMQRFVTQLSGWYEQMHALPRPTLLKLLALGGRVAKFVSS